MEALIYGYLRDDLVDDHCAELEDAMSTLARMEGLCFAATFHESTSGDGTAFAELTRELRRADAHHVVVPSLDHFAGQTIPRDILIAKLVHETAARVWTIEGWLESGRVAEAVGVGERAVAAS
ncbi:hypothetical protein [Nocardia callitridis]|uniref:Resolvase/invertase-type recombinase catalytic domain-containing protein n=1 Tax=Nocardia callitridis TaxID=648753 RepID=A0ABP9KB51_9NOCA